MNTRWNQVQTQLAIDAMLRVHGDTGKSFTLRLRALAALRTLQELVGFIGDPAPEPDPEPPPLAAPA